MRIPEIGLHGGLVLKLAMRCSTASSLLALVRPRVLSTPNFILLTWILTSSFLTHVDLKVFVALWFANHCPGACSACDLALFAVWTACDAVRCSTPPAVPLHGYAKGLTKDYTTQ